MKKKTLIIWIVVAAVVIVLLIWLIGSVFAKPQVTAVPEPAPSASQTVLETAEPTGFPTPSSLPTPTGTIVEKDDPVEYHSNKIEYTYHDVSSDKDKTVSIDAGKDSDLTLGLQTVAQEFFGAPLDQTAINPNFIELQGGQLHIDFSQAIYDLNLGSSGEVSLLDSIASAYLDNIPDLTAVYYTVDGAGYSSGHVSFGEREAYRTK